MTAAPGGSSLHEPGNQNESPSIFIHIALHRAGNTFPHQTDNVGNTRFDAFLKNHAGETAKSPVAEYALSQVPWRLGILGTPSYWHDPEKEIPSARTRVEAT